MKADAENALELAVNKSVFDIGIKDSDGQDIQIFYPNHDLGSNKSNDTNDQHLVVSILPIDKLRSLMQISIKTLKGTGTTESGRIKKLVKEFFKEEGKEIAQDGFSFYFSLDDPDPYFFVDGFMVQPVSLIVKYIKRC